MTTHNAIIQGGKLLLETPLPYPDGTRVKVHLEPSDVDPLLFLADLAVATGITDLAEQHNHYVYGTPKVQK